MDGFGKDLGRQCPVLQELYLKRCDVHMNVVASPTLASLTIIRPSLYGSEAGPLRIIAPRLASIFDAQDVPAEKERNVSPLSAWRKNKGRIVHLETRSTQQSAYASTRACLISALL
jgi:hypothetical protein